MPPLDALPDNVAINDNVWQRDGHNAHICEAFHHYEHVRDVSNFLSQQMINHIQENCTHMDVLQYAYECVVSTLKVYERPCCN
jgi:hypothetical protein